MNCGMTRWKIRLAYNGRRTGFLVLGSSRVAVIDAKTYAVEKYLPVGQRVGQLAFTPDQKLLFTTNGTSNDVSVIDVENFGSTLGILGLAGLGALAAATPTELALRFARNGERSLLAAVRHAGPLRMQKALYPEGDGVCHAIVLHPPAGIAGGDQDTHAGSRARSRGGSRGCVSLAYRSSASSGTSARAMRFGAWHCWGFWR